LDWRILKSLPKGDAFLELFAHPLARRFGHLARSYRSDFYYGLAIAFVCLIVLSALLKIFQGNFKAESLDLALRYRLSSPAPDPAIWILDIDERSLALMADSHGRWPWPRAVIAEAISDLADAGAKAIVLNVMMSDPDKANPDSDQTFNAVAMATPNAVYPMVRLNAENDKLSEVRVGLLPHVKLQNENAGQTFVAVLLPLFTGTHDKLALSNLKTDSDGVVRRFPVWWQEMGYALPTMPSRAVDVYQDGLTDTLPDEVILNWRNKQGDYRRISFADLLLSKSGPSSISLSQFRDSIVVIGISAPGIAVTKATPVSMLADDNVIIANAIDDMKNRTYLRLLPIWAAASISIVIILAMAWSFTAGVPDKAINRWFTFGQLLLIGITIGTASYTFYLVDLSDCILVTMAYFMVAKFHAIVEQGACRGAPMFFDLGAVEKSIDGIVVCGLNRNDVSTKELRSRRHDLERKFGIRNILVIDNAFASENLFGSVGKDFYFFIILIPIGVSLISDSKKRADLPNILGLPAGAVTVVRQLSSEKPRILGILLQAVVTSVIEVSTELVQSAR
jgi:CHASE2 domain-containing sensor protein